MIGNDSVLVNPLVSVLVSELGSILYGYDGMVSASLYLLHISRNPLVKSKESKAVRYFVQSLVTYLLEYIIYVNIIYIYIHIYIYIIYQNY